MYRGDVGSSRLGSHVTSDHERLRPIGVVAAEQTDSQREPNKITCVDVTLE